MGGGQAGGQGQRGEHGGQALAGRAGSQGLGAHAMSPSMVETDLAAAVCKPHATLCRLGDKALQRPPDRAMPDLAAEKSNDPAPRRYDRRRWNRPVCESEAVDLAQLLQ
jgi:hypothetical protein